MTNVADTDEFTDRYPEAQTLQRDGEGGGNTVAENLSTLTDPEAELYVTRINMLEVFHNMAAVGPKQRIGIAVELVEPPHGHILFLIDAPSAKRLAGHMLGDGPETGGDGFSEMEKSAIEAFGNIMTSGFIDGWVNVLQTTIDISTHGLQTAPGTK